ncbi:MAG TPA: site-specific integrase [Nitrososphaeraceae archaeon]
MPTRTKNDIEIVSVSRSPTTQDALSKYIKSISLMSASSAREYGFRLHGLANFTKMEYKTNLDDLIKAIKEGSYDPYDILCNYIAYLQARNTISTSTLKQRVITAKNFLEYYDVDISPRKFKIKIKLPKIVRKDIDALTKEDIINILNACSDIRLKTYVMLLASTGMRASEALCTRLIDYDLGADPPKLLIRGEYTKTKVSRTVFLTQELVVQISLWLEYKYRTRRICHKDEKGGKTRIEYKTLRKNDRDLLFSVNSTNPSIRGLYFQFAANFGKTLDRMGKGNREEVDHSRRRRITLHSMRRWVKSTISDLGYGDFSEFMIGHSSSTYYRRTVDEKAALFRKIEPYLTFLDYQQLERRGADISAQLQEKDKQIQTLVKKQEDFERLIQSLIDSGQLKPNPNTIH